jgi:hypothetical protein
MVFMNGKSKKINGASIVIFLLATASLILPSILVSLRVNLSDYS